MKDELCQSRGTGMNIGLPRYEYGSVNSSLTGLRTDKIRKYLAYLVRNLGTKTAIWAFG